VLQPQTVPAFLRWFDAKRRGCRVSCRFRNASTQLRISTSPDFDWAYIAGLIAFREASPGWTTAKSGINPWSQSRRTSSAGCYSFRTARAGAAAPGDCPLFRKCKLPFSPLEEHRL
jgi:hypothetical protein